MNKFQIFQVIVIVAQINIAIVDGMVFQIIQHLYSFDFRIFLSNFAFHVKIIEIRNKIPQIKWLDGVLIILRSKTSHIKSGTRTLKIQ